MLRRAVPLVLAALGLAASARALTLKLEYNQVKGTFSYYQDNQNAIATNWTSQSADATTGVLGLGFEQLAPVADHIAAGFEFGVSMPGDFTFSMTNLFIPAAGSPNQDTGDQWVAHLTRLPILVKGVGSFDVGPGTAQIGLGLGTTIVSWATELQDQLWSNGVGGPQSDEDTAHQVRDGMTTTYANGVAQLFTVQIAPAFKIKAGPKDAITVEIPISISSKVKVAGAETSLAAAQPGISNPLTGSNGPGSNPPGELEVGGTGFGFQVAWTHAL